MLPVTVLTRVAALDGGRLAVGRLIPGRGAWLCTGSEECVNTAVRRKAFPRALRRPVSAGDLCSLRSELKSTEGQVVGGLVEVWEDGDPELPAITGVDN